MFENTSLDQFSLLDELPTLTPVWHPFTQNAARKPAVAQETQQENTERSH
ncbi:hypothetical protein NOV72_00721 [Caballeronia novacaledonica]|uniref:Uncharacterized protein n=1 Tax=Caballeronia novacaledonica TaxID=1544861 RepID=A0A2U3I033_9BURK|nr:hypothetical protein [Caballeronia novacaledonica]SPB13423.1 hypothetical protein NOV72_00721 [Caballeronia novacaledonica]